MSSTRASRLFWLVVAAYLLLAVAYGAVNPLFEAPDENWHYFTTQFVADERQLPFVADENSYDEFLSQEAAQPPLYYVLGALLIAPLDTAEARTDLWLNPFAVIGNASALTNINNAVHTQIEAWPWQGWPLAAHLLRLFSTLLGLGTLVCIWKAGRLLWPEHAGRALLATALVAFLPQFLFLHGSITNDTLIIFLASLGLWQMVRIWQDGMDLGRGVLLGITCGLAILTKNAGTLLLIYAVGDLILLALRDRVGWRKAASWLAALILPALLIGGWLWLRNWQLYGDPTATEPFIRIAGGDRGYTLWQVLAETRGLWVSLFAVFGWFNLRSPDWVYWFWSGVVGLAAVGALWQMVRAPKQRSTAGDNRIAQLLSQAWALPLLLAGWVLAVYAGLLLFMLQTEAAQGRLLFPAILPLALGVAFGLSHFRRLTWVVVAGTWGIAIFCLVVVIQPAYQRPPIVARVADSAEADIALGDGVVLAGAEMISAEITPNDPVEMILYWRGESVSGDPVPEQVISVFGQGMVEIGKLHSYHGRGLYPATLWPEAGVVADTFGLRLLDENPAVPVLARVTAGISDQRSVQVGEIKIVPQQWPELAGPDLAVLGNVAAVTRVTSSPEQAHAGDVVTVDVQWRSLGASGIDYTVLLHLGQPDATPLAVGDRPPLHGDYPTRVWDANERINDSMGLIVPEGLELGRYPIWLGMYDSKTFERLPVFIDDTPQPHNVYLAGWVEIE